MTDPVALRGIGGWHLPRPMEIRRLRSGDTIGKLGKLTLARDAGWKPRRFMRITTRGGFMAIIILSILFFLAGVVLGFALGGIFHIWWIEEISK